MKPARGEHGDGDGSRPRRRSRHHSDSSFRDDSSVDSGYYGSSASPVSPRASHKRLSRDHRHLTGTKDDRSHASSALDAGRRARSGADWDDSGSESDYDPKAKYYAPVDDDAYREISFRGGQASDQPPLGESSKEKRREGQGEGEHHARRRRRQSSYQRRDPSSHRRRSVSSNEGDIFRDLHRHGDHSPRQSSRCPSDLSRSRRDSCRRPLSPIPSDQSEGWQTSSERAVGPQHRSRSHVGRLERDSSRDSLSDISDLGSTDAQAKAISPKSRVSSGEPRRSRTRNGDGRERSLQDDKFGSSSYKGAADMDDAWYKTFKDRITRGVDMKQVKKVGLDAAAVAAVKVAVGTQMPWKQRIPKTIAVGLAAAVTDFLISKTSVKPKGMVGTIYARQLVEIALANLVINPISNKVTGAAQKPKGRAGAGRRR